MNRTRPKQIVIRMSEDEYEKIKKKVEQSGMSQQEYLIKALTQKEIKNTEALRELFPQLGKIGSNLNQIARKLNQIGYIDFNGELRQALKGCDDIWQLLRQYLQKLP